MTGIDIGRFGIWRRVAEIDEDMAREAERLGFGAIWIGGSPPGDLIAVEEILDATERIPVVTGIVNMWREDAATVAAAHHRLRERHPGRFLLGVGIGHPEATSEYSDPVAKIESYLDELEAAGVPKVEIILAALGPRVLRIAAERTAGAHPYLTTPIHTRFAREVLGDGPILAPEHFVVVADGDQAHDAGRQTVGRYLRLDNYRRNLAREGWDETDLDDGGSDRLIEALVLQGSPERIADGLRAHIAAGADHVSLQVIGGDPDEAHRQIAAALQLS
ncbi:MAG: TIGR03620 family F420-dependent LLM class oxidoreductase [Acidimicrobiia bacterium]